MDFTAPCVHPCVFVVFWLSGGRKRLLVAFLSVVIREAIETGPASPSELWKCTHISVDSDVSMTVRVRSQQRFTYITTQYIHANAAGK